MTKELEEAFKGLSHADALRVNAKLESEKRAAAAMDRVYERLSVEDVKEDSRLFLKSHRSGVKDGLRMNAWFPFEDRYWPYANHQEDRPRIIDGATLLLLERAYDPTKGAFSYRICVNTSVPSDLHPNRTRAYVGFMILSSDSAMAALLIPASAKDPIV